MRRFLLFAFMLMLLAGCGQSHSRTPTEEALAYVNKGAYDKAIETCNEALKANPQDAEALLYRGRAYQFREGAGDLERAIADFTEAINIAPKGPEAYYSRSIAYRDQGDPNK